MLLIERFKIGMKESLSKKITESDIIIFSKFSDKNPIHLSDEFAKKLDLKKLSWVFICIVIFRYLWRKTTWSRLLVLSQSLQFKYPVYDDIVIATVKIIDIVAEKHIKIFYYLQMDKTTVIDGIAEIYIPKQ